MPGSSQRGQAVGRGRSPWATITSVHPASRRSATLLLTAALSPMPGCHRIGGAVLGRPTRRPARRRRRRRWAVRRLPRAPAPTSSGRAARDRRRPSTATVVPWRAANALTGTRTTAFTPGIVGTYAAFMPINVAVIGAGSWGTTVAALAAVNTPTILWARRPELAGADQRRPRQRRLPGQLHAARAVARDQFAGGGGRRRRRAGDGRAVARLSRRGGRGRAVPAAVGAGREPDQGDRAQLAASG